jgi:RNA methyltransferase, TrmH family
MLNKKLVKDIQSLGHKKFREESGWFVAEGPKIISELLQIVPEQFHRIYATKDWMAIAEAEELTEIITEYELKSISFLKTPHQVLAVIRQLPDRAPQIEKPVLYLDTIQDPGNFGTIIRIADWFGISDVICTEGCADLYNPKVVQSTMASIARVNVFYDREHQWLKAQNSRKIAATLNGKPVYDYQRLNQGILMIGNESKGLDDELLRMADEQITIPKAGAAESLNAAVATGIILSHII